MKKGTQIATIDAALVTVTTHGETPKEIGIKTSSNVQVTVNTSVTEAIQHVVNGVLLAQKGKVTTITGNTIVLTDNVFNFELAQIFQGGTIIYDAEDATKVIGYKPPVQGSEEIGEMFDLSIYTAIYNEAAALVGYEKTTYPNCTGEAFGKSTEYNVFRVMEYTVTSAPEKGQAPYDLAIVDVLPTVTE